MSFHMHLRAMAEHEIRDDHAWLTDFMHAAWEKLETEYESGIAASIEKDFGPLNDLYLAGATTTHELPVYGGRIIQDPAHHRPPFAILTSLEATTAAELLRDTHFETLWSVAGPALAAPYALWDDPETAAKATYLAHHTALCGFYTRAAQANHAVVKAFWY
ncbi:DUF1877 family protein [Streptomyces sp. NBC_01353]|uniref:DUF1877 family protein n=1 Tax=Streptomyces sp. NBC_01353 TaxID=2903835 RepID=UPI002E37C274|nr:DUF1877 family protein [Streptomyces sp. NBC_01353]